MACDNGLDSSALSRRCQLSSFSSMLDQGEVKGLVDSARMPTMIKHEGMNGFHTLFMLRRHLYW